MAGKGKSGSRFIVNLGDIKLSQLEERQLSTEIQAVVLRALAHHSAMSSQRVQRKSWHWDDLWNKFEGGTVGLWPKGQPPVWPV